MSRPARGRQRRRRREEEEEEYTIWVEVPPGAKVEVPRREVILEELERLKREGLVEVRETPEGLEVVAKGPTARERVQAVLSKAGFRPRRKPARERLKQALLPATFVRELTRTYIPTGRLVGNLAYGLAAAAVAVGIAQVDGIVYSYARESPAVAVGALFSAPFALAHAAVFFVLALLASTVASVPMTIFYNAYRRARGLDARAALFALMAALMACISARSWLYAVAAYGLGGAYVLLVYALLTVGSAAAFALVSALLALGLATLLIIVVLLLVLVPVGAFVAGLLVAAAAGLAAFFAAMYLMRAGYQWLSMLAYMFIVARIYAPQLAYLAAAGFVIYAGIRAAAGDWRSFNAVPAVVAVTALPQLWTAWTVLEDTVWLIWREYAEWLGTPGVRAAEVLVRWILSSLPPWVWKE